MRVRLLRRVASMATACALFSGAITALAQPAALPDDMSETATASANARARYNLGTKAFSEKRFVEAALNFEAAAAEKASPVALYTAALSWEQANVPERSADDYARALAVGGLPPDKAALARERLASLEGVFGAISVSGPEGTRVELDANSELTVPAILHAAAGVHSLSVHSPGSPIERRPVLLERGKTTKLDLKSEPPPPATGDVKRAPAPPRPAPLPPPVAESGSWRHSVGWTAIGAGGALLLSGVVLGSEAIGARDVYRGSPTPFAYDHASELQTWTNVAFVAGGILAGAGIALVVWPSTKSRTEPAPKPESVGLVPTLGGLLLKGAF